MQSRTAQLDLNASAVAVDTLSAGSGRAGRINIRTVFFALVLLAALAGFALGYASTQAGAVAAGDPELAVLLRFTALTKLALAAAGAWLIGWRLRYPASPSLSSGYIAASALMAASPGLIWFMTQIIAAAGLFHGGLILAGLLALRDGRLKAS